MAFTTRAAVHTQHGSPLTVTEITLPDPGPTDVLVELFASGICHSQLHQLHNPETPTPGLMGHEATGKVIALGSQVSHVKEGQRVMLTWVPRDVTPETGRDRNAFRAAWEFEGKTNSSAIYTWAEHVLAHEQMVVPLDESVPTDVTAIVGCATVTGVGAVLGSAKVPAGATVAIFGVGGVGINAIAGAKIADAERIIAVDLSEEKLDFAKEFGATDTINASETDPVEAIVELTNGGVDFAFDAIGYEVTMRQILNAVRPGVLGGGDRGGTAVLIGVPQTDATIDAKALLMGERNYIGSLGGTSHPMVDFKQYIEWYKQGALPLEKMISVKYDGLDSINEGIDTLESGKISGRSIMIYKES
tara:strand:- start:3771 stop:4850 length:1080 start_codon:yes stop_codon:yes gene_type:complete